MAKAAESKGGASNAAAPKAGAGKAAKPRILYLCRILAEETDPEHGLSLPQNQEKLDERGISCERKALYRDFDALDAAGVKVGRLHTRPVAYYLESRPFDPAQLMLLADAVQTSRSITKSNSNALIRRLKKLASKSQAKSIDARVHVSGRVKMQNESIFRTLDLVQRAIAEKRDISFCYMRYDANKRLRDVPSHDGKDRVKTPLHLVYSNDNYYMLSYDDDAPDHIRVYRADRMRNILVLGKSDRSHRLDPGFDVAAYEKQSVDMYGGRPQLHEAACGRRPGGQRDRHVRNGRRGVFEGLGREGARGRRQRRLQRWRRRRKRRPVGPQLGRSAREGGAHRHLFRPHSAVRRRRAHRAPAKRRRSLRAASAEGVGRPTAVGPGPLHHGRKLVHDAVR